MQHSRSEKNDTLDKLNLDRAHLMLSFFFCFSFSYHFNTESVQQLDGLPAVFGLRLCFRQAACGSAVDEHHLPHLHMLQKSANCMFPSLHALSLLEEDSLKRILASEL